MKNEKMIKTAAILAAGLGSRLEHQVGEKPKGFIVIDGKPIVEESVLKLLECGIERIIIGTGYESQYYEELARKFPQIDCIHNDKFREAGSMFTLYSLRHKLTESFVLLESDLVYHEDGLKVLLEDRNEDVILGSGRTGAHDAVHIAVDHNEHLVDMSKDPSVLHEVHAEFVGISKMTHSAYQNLCRFFEEEFKNNPRLDYDFALPKISEETKFYVRKHEELVWCEIDDEDHLIRAREIVVPRIRALESRDKIKVKALRNKAY